MAPVSVDERAHLLGRSGDQSPSSRRRGSRILPHNTSMPPPMNRKLSRIRTNSVSILNDDGDDLISTSFGPVLLHEAPSRNRDWILGWFLAIISGVLFTANNFFVKFLNIDALEMLLIRSGMQTLLILIGIITTRTPLLPHSTKDRVLVILQGLLSGGRVFLQFSCLAFMPLGDALTLVFTEPLWTIILSKIVLKIDIGWWKTIFGVFLISGMVLCIQPPFIFPQEDNNGTTTFPTTTTEYTTTTEFTTTTPLYTTMLDFEDTTFMADLKEQSWPKLEKLIQATGLPQVKVTYEETEHVTGPAYGVKYYIGAVLALSTAIMGSTANVIIAKCESVSSSVMVFYSGLGGVVLALACSFMDSNNRIVFDITSIPYDQWLILVMLGGSGLIGYYSMTRSLQLIPPTTVAVLRALEIILAYIAQAVVMGEIPNTLAICGSSIVMFSVIAFALEETILSCYRCF